MANTKQAKKMIRKIKRRTQYNRWWKSKIKRAISALDKIASQNSSEINKLYANLQKTVDKAAKKGVIHKNKANRIKSKSAKKLALNTKTAKVKKTNSGKLKKNKSL